MANPWFKITGPTSGKETINLCVFHHAGGSSNVFFKWKKELPESWGLVLVELPGRGTRYHEALAEDFNRLNSELLRAFEDVEGPVILAGHSMGALIAFELYRGLKPEKAKNVRGLLISSFLPPTKENLSNRTKLSHLSEEAFLSKVQQYAEIPNEVLTNPLAKDYFLRLLRGDFRLLESYANSDFVRRDIPMMICGGANDQIMDARQLDDWDQFGRLIDKTHIFPGDHFYITQHYRELIAAAVLAFS